MKDKKPFLLQFEESAKEVELLNVEYDQDKHISYITDDGNKIPLVEASSVSLGTRTKTAIVNETSDEDIDSNHFFGTRTITEINNEATDHD